MVKWMVVKGHSPISGTWIQDENYKPILKYIDNWDVAESIVQMHNSFDELFEAVRGAKLFIGGLKYSESPCPPELWEKMKAIIEKTEGVKK